MFERFASRFRLSPEGGAVAPAWADERLSGVSGYAELMATNAGGTFDDGLYRLHSSETAPVVQELVDVAFPRYAERLRVFGFDWLGRQFAVDFGRSRGGEPLVMMLEPGTGGALEIPATFVGFHDDELVDYPEEALAEQFFAAWAAANPGSVPLAPDRCVGYRVPLFLDGADDLDNLELSDIEDYWTAFGQLRSGTGAPLAAEVLAAMLDDGEDEDDDGFDDDGFDDDGEVPEGTVR